MFLASSPLNDQVLTYLRARHGSAERISAPDTVRDPYLGQGSHPDVVARVWDQIGRALPVDSRCLAYGTPALVQSESGILLGFCLGTAYCLRLRESSLQEALQLGAQTSQVWAGGRVTDTRVAFGPDWIFGRWLSQELRWCCETYQSFANIDKGA